MSTEFVIGLVGLAVWLAYKVWLSDRFDTSGANSRSWAIPVVTLSTVLVQMYLFTSSWTFYALPESLVLVMALTFFILTPFIGVQTLAMLHLQGRLTIAGLNGYKMKTAVVCACLDLLVPLSILALNMTGSIHVMNDFYLKIAYNS